MSKPIDAGSRRSTERFGLSQDGRRPKRTPVDQSEDELELGHFIGEVPVKPTPESSPAGRPASEAEVVGPRRKASDRHDRKPARPQDEAGLQIAAARRPDPAPKRARARRRRTPTQSGNHWRHIAWLALASLVMIALTTATFSFLSRYAPVGDPLLDDPSFAGWQQKGEVTLDPNQPGRVTLANQDPNGRPHLWQTIDLPPGDSLLILKAEVQGDNVVTGDELWESGRVYLVQLDADGKPDWSQDHFLFQLNGTTGVRNYSRLFSIPASVTQARLGIDLNQATGRMTVGKLKLTAVEREMPFMVVAACLMLVWGGLAAYTVFATLRGIESRTIRIWLGAACALSVIGLLIPGGIQEQIVKTLLDVLGFEKFDTDVIAHGIVFTILVFLVRLGRPQDPFWLHLGVWLLIALTTEILQLFTFDRDPSLDDLLTDGAGILLGLSIGQFLPSLLEKVRSERVRRSGR